MTAWTLLIGNSTIPDNNIAWDHLNNQDGGTGGDLTINRITGLNVIAENNPVDVIINDEITQATALENIQVTVEDPRIIAIIEDDNPTGNGD